MHETEKQKYEHEKKIGTEKKKQQDIKIMHLAFFFFNIAPEL